MINTNKTGWFVSFSELKVVRKKQKQKFDAEGKFFKITK